MLKVATNQALLFQRQKVKVACDANVTILYHTKKGKKTTKGTTEDPHWKKAIGTCLSVEDESEQSTVWHKGMAIISYTRKDGYVVSFDRYGPEESKTIKSLRKAMERNEIKLL